MYTYYITLHGKITYELYNCRMLNLCCTELPMQHDSMSSFDYSLTKKYSMGVYLPSFDDNFRFLDLLCVLTPCFWSRLEEHKLITSNALKETWTCDLVSDNTLFNQGFKKGMQLWFGQYHQGFKSAAFYHDSPQFIMNCNATADCDLKPWLQICKYKKHSKLHNINILPLTRYRCLADTGLFILKLFSKMKIRVL